MNSDNSYSFLEEWKRKKDCDIGVKESFPSNKKRLSLEITETEPNPRRKKLNKQKQSVRYCRSCCARTCFFGFGGVVAVLGILITILWPLITNTVLQKMLALTPGSSVYNGWVETPIPVHFKVYMFNWTNPETSLRGPDKPIFEELGPYVFLKHQIKQNIFWNDNNDTITYQILDQYKYFIPELSNGSLSDRVTNVNVIPMVIGWYCRNLSWFEKVIVNNLITMVGADLVKTDTVGNILFSGSEDPILNILQKVKRFVKNIPLTDKFGWLYTVNYSSTADGVYTMNTGKNDITTLGLASAWNYSNRTMLDGECGVVNGSFGELYPPDTYNQDKVYMFGYATCSSGALYREEYSSVAGIPTAKFIGTAASFGNTPSCFCPPDDPPCPASGAHDMSQCVGIPLYLSWPHFYLADASYRDAVVGMNPDPAVHKLFFHMTDVTAATVVARFKMQSNFLMSPIEHMGLFKNVQRIIMPVFWTSQEADVGSDTLTELYWVVHGVRLGRWVSLIIGLFGVVLFGTGVIVHTNGCSTMTL